MPATVFLTFSADKLDQLSGRIRICLDKLTDEQIWMRNSPNENAVGNLVLHLCGNMRQWIGVGIAGLPEVRDRDAEFAATGGLSAVGLKAILEGVTRETVSQIEAVSDARLGEMVRIQKYDVTVLEAIYHVVEHFAGHAGQIIFAAKLLTGEDLGFYKHLSKPRHSEAVP